MPATGKIYRLKDRTATLIVRPRGWHLPEKHVHINGEPVSGALFDFALFLANNHEALARAAPGPTSTCRRWRAISRRGCGTTCSSPPRTRSGMPRGTIKATVLIETILAAFEMDEILYELREHSAGLNCGRWDYIFSFIKKFRNRPDFVLPDRATVTMDRHFLKSYVELLIKTCHRRGAHAMGGMAAQIPIRDDPAANEAAMARVRADKLREASAGHDGTWVAHPGLAPIAREPFDAVMRGPNQLGGPARGRARRREPTCCESRKGAITEAGLRHNIRVGVQYLEAWLRRQRLRAALSPHGGRGHRRDLPRAALAVAAPRRAHQSTAPRHASSASTAAERRSSTASTARWARRASRRGCSRAPRASSSR